MSILRDLVMTVIGYLQADWLFLLVGVLIAAGINVYLDPTKFQEWMERKAGTSILASIAFGTLTPLCACGTMAVLLSMFMSSLPWGPVMAFLVSSPLTSPSEYVFETGVLGSGFANAMVVASVLLGLAAGTAAHWLSMRTDFFKNQLVVGLRSKCGCSEAAIAKQDCCAASSSTASSCGCSASTKPDTSSCSCSISARPTTSSCGCSASAKSTTSSLGCTCSSSPRPKETWIERFRIRQLSTSLVELGVKRVLLYFVIFIAVGRLVEMVIPAEWIVGLFGASRSYSIPLAATFGLPLYVSGPSALPLIKSFQASGAGPGAILAFMIAGKATGVPVIAGLSTLIRRRALFFYVAFVYVGAILAGFVYQLLQ